MAERKPLVINGNAIQALASTDVLPHSTQAIPALIERASDILWSPCPASGAATGVITSGRGYFTYFGKLAVNYTVNYVGFVVSTAAAGTQTAEVAIYSSTDSPSPSSSSYAYSSAVLTPLGSTGSLEALTTTGFRKNSSALGVAVTKGTHLWAGIRTAMGTTQPNTLRAPDPNYLGYQQSGVVSALTTAGNVTNIGRQTVTFSHPWMVIIGAVT